MDITRFQVLPADDVIESSQPFEDGTEMDEFMLDVVASSQPFEDGEDLWNGPAVCCMLIHSHRL